MALFPLESGHGSRPNRRATFYYQFCADTTKTSLLPATVNTCRSSTNPCHYPRQCHRHDRRHNPIRHDRSRRWQSNHQCCTQHQAQTQVRTGNRRPWRISHPRSLGHAHACLLRQHRRRWHGYRSATFPRQRNHRHPRHGQRT